MSTSEFWPGGARLAVTVSMRVERPPAEESGLPGRSGQPLTTTTTTGSNTRRRQDAPR